MTGEDTPPRALEPSLPSTWYRTSEVFALEKERIFFREWICALREEELPHPGDHRLVDVAGESIIVVRTRDDAIHAFYNVCRHRGARLCQVTATTGAPMRGGVIANRILCPYHQWTYDFDGRLIAAPHLTGADIDLDAYRLYGVGVARWGGFIFLNLTPGSAPDFSRQAGGIPDRVARYALSQLRIGRTLRYSVAANWKILCENYNECYHCAGVHPELCALVPAFRDSRGAHLDWERGIPHREGAWTFTASGTTTRRPFPALNEDERTRHKGELLYPNLFLSLACEHVAAFILQPRDAGHTDITCHFLFEAEAIAQAGFDPSDAVDFWDRVNRQDWEICEIVQQGIGSRVHVHGYYAPMEDSNLDIRRYVRERLMDPVLHSNTAHTTPLSVPRGP